MSRIIFSLLTAALLLTACTGAQGPVGPEGPQGSQGATGQTGAAGQNGADGKDGATGPTGQTGAPGQTGAAGQNGADGKDGATGPAGQTGAPGSSGTPGSPGPSGPTGPQGPTGNANVQMYTIAYDSPNRRDDGDSIVYTVPGITQAQLDSSVVLCYGQLVGEWIPTPGVYPPESSFITMSVAGGVLSIRSIKISAGGIPLGGTDFSNFRVIIISATKVTSLSLHGPNLNDYNAVKAYYHLSD